MVPLALLRDRLEFSDLVRDNFRLKERLDHSRVTAHHFRDFLLDELFELCADAWNGKDRLQNFNRVSFFRHFDLFLRADGSGREYVSGLNQKDLCTTSSWTRHRDREV